MDSGRWKPIKIANTGPRLSHLFFADDLVLFVEASEEQLHVIMDCMLDIVNEMDDIHWIILCS